VGNQDFTKINQTFNKQLSEFAAKTKDQVTFLDKALSEVLQKSLERLRRQLTARLGGRSNMGPLKAADEAVRPLTRVDVWTTNVNCGSVVSLRAAACFLKKMFSRECLRCLEFKPLFIV